ncbi:MAG TPA: response regulator [Gammaproteobacteria bacterium]
MLGKLIDILLVEDNDDHVELIRQTLEDRRIANSIVHFDNAEEALSYLNREGKYAKAIQPGMVLLDLNLPGMSGQGLLQTIKESERLKSIPVVVLTTSSGESDRVTAYRHYVNSYLVKPINADQFERMVNDLGLYWGVWNKLEQDPA